MNAINESTEIAAIEAAAVSAPPVPPMRVLLVEDDIDLCKAIFDYLAKQGIAVLTEGRGDHALARIAADKPDLVLLDVMLPGKDGFDVCRELRASGNNVPVIILTAKDEDFDEVLGLELGADDYLAKPIQPRVLLARIKAANRRSHSHSANVTNGAHGAQGMNGLHADVRPEGDVLEFGRLRIHGPNREVTLGDKRIELSPAEFDLLWLLASNAGKVMQRGDILKSLRGLHYNGADRSVDARLYRLRRRFSSESESAWKIKTVRPHGYMFCMEPW